MLCRADRKRAFDTLSDKRNQGRNPASIRNIKRRFNGYFKIEINKPYPNRTTGQGSQNNLFYALLTELCKVTGNDLEDAKDALKEKAIKRGYPYRVNKLTGRIKPYSTTEVNTVEMGYLIDETKQECCENGINPDLI